MKTRLAVFGILIAAGNSIAHEVGPYFAGDRILVDATIGENQRLRLSYDTGADSTLLFGSAAKRLGLETENEQNRLVAGHPVRFAQTKPLKVSLLGLQAESRLSVMLSADGGWLDGLLCWRDLSAPYFLIDGYERRIRTANDPPKDAAAWQKWKLEKDTRQLFFEVTKDGKPLGRVFVDTGASTGLRLAPKFWKQWREKNPDAGLTLESFQYLVGEPEINEIGWASEYQLGDLIFRNVETGQIPLSKTTEDGLSIDANGKPYIAMIGSRALRHLRLILRQAEGEIWTQSVSPIPNHNRLGAVFVPRGKGEPGFVARVLAGSPAHRAGLRDGDILREIEGIDFSQDPGDSGQHPSHFLNRPAGTELKVKVERAGEVLEVSVMLQELLVPQE